MFISLWNEILFAFYVIWINIVRGKQSTLPLISIDWYERLVFFFAYTKKIAPFINSKLCTQICYKLVKQHGLKLVGINCQERLFGHYLFGIFLKKKIKASIFPDHFTIFFFFGFIFAFFFLIFLWRNSTEPNNTIPQDVYPGLRQLEEGDSEKDSDVASDLRCQTQKVVQVELLVLEYYGREVIVLVCTFGDRRSKLRKCVSLCACRQHFRWCVSYVPQIGGSHVDVQEVTRHRAPLLPLQYCPIEAGFIQWRVELFFNCLVHAVITGAVRTLVVLLTLLL